MSYQTTPAASGTTSREQWKNTILAGLANYIDGGSIVAGAAALALWAERYNLSAGFVGLIGAFSANAISAGVGALIGGWLCDRYGRKKIYQYDMLFYAFGMLWLVFAFEPWTIVIGFILVGLAVGADIPASWSLIAETAPGDQRGKHSGVATLLWVLGPVVVVLLFILVAPLGDLGSRLVFAHLAVLALVLTLLRARMQESALWAAAKFEREQKPATATDSARVKILLQSKYLWAMAFLIGMYGIQNLFAGTIGFFFPYILRTVGGQSQSTATLLQLAQMILALATIFFVFMPLVDKVSYRLLFGLSALSQIAGMALLAIFNLNVSIVLTFLFLSSFGMAQAFYQLWSAELFPTLLRSTAQGITFAIVRIGLGIWSLFVPALASADFQTLAWLLTGFLVVSGFIGVIWAPRNEGKSLEQIEAERSL